jgi:UV DNA damage endonuclease
MPPNLGLVCITAAETIRYRTITRTNLLRLSEPQQQERLAQLYEHNLAVLNRAVDFCAARGLRLYRVSAHIFPFADTPLGQALLESYRPALQRTGQRIALNPAER